MKGNKIVNMLKDKKVVVEGHFLLTSGKHSDTYIQCARVLQDPQATMKLMEKLIKEMKDINVDLVIGPATGGVILAYEAGRQLGVDAIFTERENGKMILRRGFEIPKGAKVLLVEDVVTTGGSVKEVLGLVQEKGGNVVAIGILADRTGGEIDFNLPTFKIFSKKIESYEESQCPLCKEDIPAVKPGSRELE